jgi:molybdenum cofactor cytidylyltransferase
VATEAGASSILEAIVLAGGAGSRFGGGKLTAPWRDGVLLDGALRAAFAAPVRSVMVVTGADPLVAPVARAWVRAHGQARRLRLIHAPDHAEGMAATLRAGIAALPADVEGAFIFLGDMPLIPVTIPPRLAEALASGALAAAPVFEGRRGHPVLFSRALFKALAALKGDEGARSVLREADRKFLSASPSAAGPVALVETEDLGIFSDVDFPRDLSSG